MADEIGDAVSYFQGWAFGLEIDGILVGNFEMVGPLKQEFAIIAQESGGARTTVDETIGKYKTEKVTAQRGQSSNNELWLWHLNNKAGIKDKRNCSVVQYDTDGITPLLRWNLALCNMTSFDAGSFDATKDANMIEKIELKPIDIDRVG